MPLIKCPSCDKDVSSEAPACPHCGHPIRPTTIQKTSKKWKGLKLLSVLTVIIGIALASTGQEEDNIAWLLIMGGIITFVIAFVGSWWHHG